MTASFLFQASPFFKDESAKPLENGVSVPDWSEACCSPINVISSDRLPNCTVSGTAVGVASRFHRDHSQTPSTPAIAVVATTGDLTLDQLTSGNLVIPLS